jgi:superfamily II DNA or RNA helicase
MNIVLRPYQRECVDKIMWALDSLPGNNLVSLPTGCHEADYPIQMADGSLKVVQDVDAGDFVMGPDGGPRIVMSLHHGFEEGFRVTAINGESFVVNAGHLLHLRSSAPDKYYPDHVDVSVREYITWAKSRKHMYKLEKRGYAGLGEAPIPYLLGLWLGDGSSRVCQITNVDPEVIAYLVTFAAFTNTRYRKLGAPYLHSITALPEIPRKKKAFNPFRYTLEHFDLFQNKHIPEVYFHSDRDSRLQLLAGLLDTDGSFCAAKNTYELGLSNERLFDDCIRLVRSLGLRCTKHERMGASGFRSFRTHISGEGQEEIPCLIERKQARPRLQKKNALRFGFTVEPVGEIEYYGFDLLGKDRLYLDGQGFVHHNSGKSIVIAEVGQRYGGEVLILQPSREILGQNREKLMHYVPVKEIGTYSASFNSRQIRKYTFATIQSIYRKPELFRHFKLVLVDEAHSVNQKAKDSMFASFFSAIGQPRVVGFTATPFRNVQAYHGTQETGFTSQITCKLMTRMRPAFWARMIYHVNNADLITAGYLCPMIYDDLSRVSHEQIPVNAAHSDFNLEAFEDKVRVYIPEVIEKIKECEKEFHSVLVFCSSVAQAHGLSKTVSNSRAVSGETPAKERAAIIDGFKAGRIKTVFNMGVLTTGFDHPALDCIVLIRPTKSLSLYYQMLGRGVRLCAGKRFCTVIDYSGTVVKMGAVEMIKLVKECQPPKHMKPVWELYAGGRRMHGRALYSYAVKAKQDRAWMF